MFVVDRATIIGKRRLDMAEVLFLECASRGEHYYEFSAITYDVGLETCRAASMGDHVRLVGVPFAYYSRRNERQELRVDIREIEIL